MLINNQTRKQKQLYYISLLIEYSLQFKPVRQQHASEQCCRNVQSHTHSSSEQDCQGCDKEASCSCWPPFLDETCISVIQVCAQAITMLSECPTKETGTWLVAYICFQYNIIPRLDAAHRISIRPNHSYPTAYQFVCAGRRTSWRKEASNRTSVTEILRQMEADRKAMEWSPIIIS